MELGGFFKNIGSASLPWGPFENWSSACFKKYWLRLRFIKSVREMELSRDFKSYWVHLPSTSFVREIKLGRVLKKYWHFFPSMRPVEEMGPGRVLKNIEFALRP